MFTAYITFAQFAVLNVVTSAPVLRWMDASASDAGEPAEDGYKIPYEDHEVVDNASREQDFSEMEEKVSKEEG